MRTSAVLLALVPFCTSACGGPEHSAEPEVISLAPDGASCSLGSECASGTCLAGSICGTACESPESCSVGATCSPVTTARGLVRACGTPGTTELDGDCVEDSECAEGLCHEGHCTRLCGSCFAGAECVVIDVTRGEHDEQWPACLWRLAEPKTVAEHVMTPEGQSAELSFEVPPGQLSFVAVLESRDGLRVAPSSLISPGGIALIENAESSTNPAAPYIGVTSVLVPNGDDPAIRAEPGTWRLSVGTYDPRVFDALVPESGRVDRVSILLEAETEEGGALDLELAFSPGTDVVARTATDSPFVVELLEEVQKTLIEPAGVSLGEVRLASIPEEHDVVEDGDETRRMCRTLSKPGRHGASVNLFVVADLVYTEGHSGGAPGPPGRFDTPGSCIVIERMENGLRTGVLASHELGHFLGLRHTTELSGGGRDPLSDTPECERGMAIDDCPDRDNLMFPAYLPRSGLPLTAGQIAVIRRSPSLYERP
ncbi:MAG: hypothetical protein HYV07_01815 [Deltaproteobacteria bacterium]|nr:hypothetical protein [Deltaproteobacteria bacterium]